MAPKKTTDEARPHISVIERRLQNPFGIRSVPIELKEKGWTVRSFNNAIRPNKVWEAKQLGWQAIGKDEPADVEQMAGFKWADGYWVMGERQQEVLLKMRTEDYKKIQWAKSDKNIQMMKSPGASKRDVVEAAGRSLGDQAAEFIQRDVQIVGNVRDSKEIIGYEPGIE